MVAVSTAQSADPQGARRVRAMGSPAPALADRESLGARVRQARAEADLAIAQVDIRGVAAADYEELEAGLSHAECWGPLLGTIATALSVPSSHLVSASGRSTDVVPGVTPLVGQLVRETRQAKAMSLDELADDVGANVSVDELASLEEGMTDMEEWGPKLLRAAEALGVPLFELVAGIDPLTVKQVDALRRQARAADEEEEEHEEVEEDEPATLGS